MLLLLAGTPGTGKTTLAHCIARHAGYEPFEVNASDDRSAKSLRHKLIAAMETREVFGSNKPRCIILDEIDGSMGGGESKSIASLLLEFANTPMDEGSKYEDEEEAVSQEEVVAVGGMDGWVDG